MQKFVAEVVDVKLAVILRHERKTPYGSIAKHPCLSQVLLRYVLKSPEFA